MMNDEKKVNGHPIADIGPPNEKPKEEKKPFGAEPKRERKPSEHSVAPKENIDDFCDVIDALARKGDDMERYLRKVAEKLDEDLENVPVSTADDALSEKAALEDDEEWSRAAVTDLKDQITKVPAAYLPTMLRFLVAQSVVRHEGGADMVQFNCKLAMAALGIFGRQASELFGEQQIACNQERQKMELFTADIELEEGWVWF